VRFVVTPEGKAQAGDTVLDAHGCYYEVISVRNANDVLLALSALQPIGLYRGGHVGERNAMWNDRRRKGRKQDA
jgi:hypothetical protein